MKEEEEEVGLRMEVMSCLSAFRAWKAAFKASLREGKKAIREEAAWMGLEERARRGLAADGGGWRPAPGREAGPGHGTPSTPDPVPPPVRAPGCQEQKLRLRRSAGKDVRNVLPSRRLPETRAGR